MDLSDRIVCLEYHVATGRFSFSTSADCTYPVRGFRDVCEQGDPLGPRVTHYGQLALGVLEPKRCGTRSFYRSMRKAGAPAGNLPK